MKRIFFFSFVAIAIITATLVKAGGPLKVVTGTILTSESAIPADEDLSFNAHIVGREEDVLRQNSAGCGYSSGSWWVTVSNFAGTWQIGEILRVAFFDAGSGESNTLKVVLDESATQDTGDFSLPVGLSCFDARRTSSGIQLFWRTESEANNVGFGIYRSEKRSSKYIKIAFIAGIGNSAMPSDYQYLDKKIEKGKAYFYYLEDIDVAGERGRSKIIEVVAQRLKAGVWSQIAARAIR